MTQSNQKSAKKYYIVHSGTLPPLKPRERDREKREREGGRKYVHEKWTAADPVEKVLMSLFLFYLHFSSSHYDHKLLKFLIPRSFRRTPLSPHPSPLFWRCPWLARDLGGPRPLVNTGRPSIINSWIRAWHPYFHHPITCAY